MEAIFEDVYLPQLLKKYLSSEKGFQEVLSLKVISQYSVERLFMYFPHGLHSCGWNLMPIKFWVVKSSHLELGRIAGLRGQTSHKISGCTLSFFLSKSLYKWNSLL